MAKLRNSEREEWLRHQRQQAAYEVYWRNRIYLALRRQKQPFIDEANRLGLLSAQVTIDQLILPDQLERVLFRLYRDIAPKEGRQALQQYKQQTFTQAVVEWLQTFMYDLIRNMTDYTKRIILNIISEGLQAGDSYDMIIKRIQETGVDKVRAANIARTESNRAMGFAKYDAMKRLPYPVNVVWVAGRDNRTRGAEKGDKADHYHLNGKVMPYLQPFVDPINGDRLLFPGDVSLGASAKSVCNCRCSIVARRAEQTTTQKPITPRPAKPIKPEEVKPVEKFVPAKDIKEAEKYALDKLGLKFVSYKNIHIDIANEMNESIFKHKQVMPDLKTYGTGSAQQANKQLKAEFSEWYKKTKKYQSLVQEFGQDQADDYLKIVLNRIVPKVGKDTIAWSTTLKKYVAPGTNEEFDMTKYLGVFVNDKLTKTPDVINKIVEANEKRKWFTKDAKGFGYIMNHEFGHEIDKTINFQNSQSFLDIYNRERQKGVNNLIENLSRYGATAGGRASALKDEMIAEAWAEFLTSKTPRTLAFEIGNLILKQYHEKSKITSDFSTWANQILKIIKE